MEFQLQHQPFNLGCCFESKLGPMEPGCFGLDGHSRLPPSVDALVPGWLTRCGLLFPAPLLPPPQRSPGFSPGLALGAPSLQLAWLLALEGVQAALIRPAPSYPGPCCPSAHLVWPLPLPDRLELLVAAVGCALTTPPCPRRRQVLDVLRVLHLNLCGLSILDHSTVPGGQETFSLGGTAMS